MPFPCESVQMRRQMEFVVAGDSPTVLLPSEALTMIRKRLSALADPKYAT
jgi:hypothetical protein